MKLRKAIILVVFALTLVIIPVAFGQPMKPLRCNIEIELSFDPFGWNGEISGDIDGTFWITPLGAVFPGITEHYREEWFVETAEGTITIYQEGVWSFKSFKFKSNGYVTDATGDWTYLIGANVHVRGLTTPYPANEVFGIGKLWTSG